MKDILFEVAGVKFDQDKAAHLAYYIFCQVDCSLHEGLDAFRKATAQWNLKLKDYGFLVLYQIDRLPEDKKEVWKHIVSEIKETIRA